MNQSNQLPHRKQRDMTLLEKNRPRRKRRGIKPTSGIKFSALIKKWAINVLYWISPNNHIFLHVVRLLSLNNNPLAKCYFDHYLQGNGSNAYINTKELMELDQGVREVFFKEVQAKYKNGEKRGGVIVSQLAFTNKNWLYAMGSLTIKWIIHKNQLKAWFINKYCWHPHENRITQKIHIAAHSLKAIGARDFYIIGRPLTIPTSEIQRQQFNTTLPKATLYLL